MIFFIFSIFSKYLPLLVLFTYFSISCISNTNCPSPKLLDGAKISPKILTLGVGRNNVIDDRHRLDLQVTPVKFSHSLGQKSHSFSLTFLTQPGFRNPIWDHTNITRNGCSVSSHNHITCLRDPLGVT